MLELTATPKKQSNVIIYVPAAKLKVADMVKLPAIVRNTEVIEETLDFRRRLEHISKAEDTEGMPAVRPIIMFQAEAEGKGGTTFEKVKQDLIENYDIPPEQIAVKKVEVNNLKDVDLMTTDCSIRYIITVNALKEGDCPFAYILASLANRSSAVEVEQIVGQVLRRPYTRRFRDNLLHMCYVFRSSDDFRRTLDNMVAGLSAAGFSEKDSWAVNEDETTTPTPETVESLLLEEVIKKKRIVLRRKLHRPKKKQRAAGAAIRCWKNTPGAVGAKRTIWGQARCMGADYDRKESEQVQNSRTPEERERMTKFAMQPEFQNAKELLLPQFFLKEETTSLFGSESEAKLMKESLYRGFLSLEKTWEAKVDSDRYGYFMVFDTRAIDGALSVDEFMARVRKM